MKAKDLAALAALGIAGKFAYDKYSEKNAPASGVSPPGAKLGDRVSPINEDVEGEAQTRMDNYGNESRRAKFANEDYSNESRRAKFANEDYGNEARGKAIERYGAETTRKGIQVGNPEDYDAPRTAPRQAAPAVVAKPVADRSLAPAAVAPAAVEDDYPMPRTAPKPVVTPYNSDIMYADTVQRDPSINTGSATNQQAYARMKRQGTRPAQMPNDAAQARIARQKTSAGELAAIEAAKAKPAVVSTPAVVPTPAAPVAPAAQKFTYTKDQYGNIVRSDGKVSSTIFSAGQQGNAARNGMKRGGAVKKMASGGLASSKMSKPSGASRGDGIAQRGRTRGKYL